MKIVFAGVIEQPWMSGWQRLRALESLGHDVVPVSITTAHRQTHLDSLQRRILPVRAYERTLAGKAAHCTAAVLQAVRDHRPNLVWLEWPRLITAETVNEIKHTLPATRVVSFQNDNPFADRRYAGHGWGRFFAAIPYYDMHFVKRTTDITAYSTLGARKTALFTDGYSEELFYPESATSRFQIVFVGTSLDYRVGVLTKLTRHFGLDVHIFGERWNRTSLYWTHRHLLHAPTGGAHYRGVLCASKIALGFVSHSNQDDWTMRTFEVPACATFFLTERTPAHQEFYKEGEEAEFFSSPEECRDKIRYYLRHDAERERIAVAGYHRCTKSGYGLRARMQQALQNIGSN